jgi:hypothetical protein
MDTAERSYNWGYADGRAWGLAKATRADLETAHELKGYSGRQMLTEAVENPDAGRDYNAPDWIYPEGVPEQHLPGLNENGYRYNVALAHLDRHRAVGEEGDVEAYAEGWRDALVDLYDALQKATALRNKRTRVPQAFRKALETE